MLSLLQNKLKKKKKSYNNIWTEERIALPYYYKKAQLEFFPESRAEQIVSSSRERKQTDGGTNQ